MMKVNNTSKKRIKWTEKMILEALKNWVNEGKWNGMKDMKKNNPSLYFAIYKNLGFEEAFKRIGLDYADFKKTNKKWTEEKILAER